MAYRVSARINTETGEFELFQVDDIDNATGTGAEHNDGHERVAAAIGGLVERRPQIEEVVTGPLGTDLPAIPRYTEETEEEITHDDERLTDS